MPTSVRKSYFKCKDKCSVAIDMPMERREATVNYRNVVGGRLGGISTQLHWTENSMFSIKNSIKVQLKTHFM